MSEFHNLISAIFGIICISYAIFRWKRQRLYKLADKIPGKNGLPLLGQLHKFIFIDPKDYAKVLLDFVKKDEIVTKGWFGPKLVLITENAEVVNTIFNSPHGSNKCTSFFKGIKINNGLIVCNGEQYDRHRRILNKSFTPYMLQRFFGVFNEKSKNCIGKLSEKVETEEFDVFEYFGICTLEGFIEGHLNYNPDLCSKTLIKTIEIIRPFVIKRIFSPWFNFKPLYYLTSLRRKFEENYNILKSIIDDITESNKKCSNLNVSDSVINLLTNPIYKFNEEEVRDEILSFIYAGYETVAITLSSVVLMLAMHKDVQQKVFEEIDDIFKCPGSEVTNDILHKCSYLETVIKETMRLFPAGGIIARQTSGEIDLGDFIIPDDTTIALSIYGMHRNKTFWGKDADFFKPERFEPHNFKKINPHAYAPFSGGKRNCIGMKYAMIFMKIFLIHFFKSYAVQTSLKFKDLTIEITPTMFITQRYMISLQKRK